MAKSAQIRMEDETHLKIVGYAKRNGLTIPEAINRVLKNYFTIGTNKESDLLTRDEVIDVFNSCLSNFKG